MKRKLFVVSLFVLGCSATLYAASMDEPPATKPAKSDDEKKAEPGKLRAKLGGKLAERLDPEKLKNLKERLGKVDVEKLKERIKDIDPAKVQEMIEKFKKGDLDVEKLKELKGLLKKPGE